MDYVNAATTGTLLPHVLPIMDLKKLLHIEEMLPPTLHLTVSLEDTLHFYQYLCTHVLIANKQFLLLIDVPIQDRSQQLSTPQHNMTSTLNTLVSLMIQQWQWRCYLINSVFVRKPRDNFVMSLPHFNHSQIHHLALQVYTPRTHIVFQPDVH